MKPMIIRKIFSLVEHIDVHLESGRIYRIERLKIDPPISDDEAMIKAKEWETWYM